MSADGVNRIKELYEAFASGDVPTVLGALDEHTEWYETEGNPWFTGRPFVGTDEIVSGVFQRIPVDFEQFEIIPSRFLGDGDTVVMEGRYRAARNTKTGRPLDVEVVHIWDLRGDKIARFHQYLDTRRFAAAMGEVGEPAQQPTAATR